MTEPDSFHWCSMTGNGHKLKHRNIVPNMRNPFFPVRVNEQRKAVDFPPLEIPESCLDMVLGKWL